jgi:hypothetical protein
MLRILILGCALPLLAQRGTDLGPVEPSFQLGYVTLMLKQSARQQAMLERLLEEQQDRSSPNYHRWLTPEEFGERFGLSPGDYDAVVSWIKAQGLHVENVARGRRGGSRRGMGRCNRAKRHHCLCLCKQL